MEAYFIPRRLDEPERIAFWTLDEALVLLLPILTGLIMSWVLTGFVLGLSLFMALKKFKGNGSTNLVRFALYWFLPNVFRLQATPCSAVRRYV